jgi:hypothetical protein
MTSLERTYASRDLDHFIKLVRSFLRYHKKKKDVDDGEDCRAYWKTLAYLEEELTRNGVLRV